MALLLPLTLDRVVEAVNEGEAELRYNGIKYHSVTIEVNEKTLYVGNSDNDEEIISRDQFDKVEVYWFDEDLEIDDDDDDYEDGGYRIRLGTLGDI